MKMLKGVIGCLSLIGAMIIIVAIAAMIVAFFASIFMGVFNLIAW